MTVQLHLHRSLNAINEKHPKASAQCLCHSERFFHSVEESDVRFISSRLGSNLEDVAAPRWAAFIYTVC